jgi:hypothetical protein
MSAVVWAVILVALAAGLGAGAYWVWRAAAGGRVFGKAIEERRWEDGRP